MMPFNRMRLVHWLVAGLFLLAYVTGEGNESLHIWLGYGLIVALLLRLAFGLFRVRGFAPLFPRASQLPGQAQAFVSRAMVGGLVLGMIGCSVTGVLMVDNAKILGLSGVSPVAALFPPAVADDDDHDHDEREGEHQSGLVNGEWLEDVHEVFANGTLALAIAHVGYLFMVRRRMVWSMLGRKPQGMPAGAADGVSR